MNERIKELWYQCKSIDWSIDNPNYDHEKFAELIVKECVSYIGDKGMLAGGGCTIVGEELLHVSEGLEKYFGVKE